MRREELNEIVMTKINEMLIYIDDESKDAYIMKMMFIYTRIVCLIWRWELHVWDDNVGICYDDVNYIMMWLNEIVLYNEMII